jgi:D-alanine-D-alanine ligase
MKKIVIICGGPSSEYDISLLSTKSIVDNIDYTKYSISVCLISKNRKCKIKEIHEPEDISKWKPGNTPFLDALKTLKKFDIALLGTHGQFGEDGVLQTYLEEEKIPYTGSDSYSSRLCMDKYRSSILVKSSTNIFIPKTKVVRLRNLKNELSKLPFPVFIKPNRNGSSICSYVLKDLSSLDSILNDFYAHHKDEDEILIQEYIEKKVEISCGCLEKKDHIFIQLPPIEIVPKGSEFFDYKAKYTKNASLERIPAIGISKEQREIISKLTIDIHKLLGCRLYSRSDYLVADEKIYYLETNTLPGMTNTSLIPQESKAIGINYKDLISFYIENT